VIVRTAMSTARHGRGARWARTRRYSSRSVWQRSVRLGLHRPSVPVRAPSEADPDRDSRQRILLDCHANADGLSNIQNPIFSPGRVLDIVMEIYAITVIGSLAGALGAFLIKRDEELDSAAEPN
jgi:hypothetical protein